MGRPAALALLVTAFVVCAAGPRHCVAGGETDGRGADASSRPGGKSKASSPGVPVTDPDKLEQLRKIVDNGELPPRLPSEEPGTRAKTWMGRPILGQVPTTLDHAIRNSKCVQAHFAAAHAGSPYDQDELGHCFYFGVDGTKLDLEEGLKWHRRAASAGQVTGQFWVGHSLFTGRGVPVDHEVAAIWYRRAAEQGHEKAQHNLGYLYENGFGVAKDVASALRWQQRAAMQGDQWSQRSLGEMYATGAHSKNGPDYAIAYAWLLLASDGDDTEPKAAAETALASLPCDSSCQTEAAAVAAKILQDIRPEPRDCLLTDWKETAGCKRSNGKCSAVVQRYVVHFAANGGKECEVGQMGERVCPESECRAEL